MKRCTAVANGMLMPALETTPSVTEEQCPRGQDGRALRRAILERTFRDDRNAGFLVALFERRVVGSRIAQDVSDGPPGSSC
jgi:hypothetical protein